MFSLISAAVVRVSLRNHRNPDYDKPVFVYVYICIFWLKVSSAAGSILTSF